MNLLKRSVEYLRYRLRVRNKYWFHRLKYNGIPMHDVQRTNDGLIKILSVNILLKSTNLLFVLKAYQLLKLIAKNNQCSIVQSNDLICLKYFDITIPVDSRQEVFIFKEIFLDGVYNYGFNEATTVIDIGYNIGMASLFFANFQNVKEVIGFEPLKPTIKKAKKVLQMNTKISSKITLNEFGVSNENGVFEVNYDYERKGNAGIGKTKINSSRTEKIQVFDCKDVLGGLIKSKEKSVFMKIDCEGSEYQIVERMSEFGLLAKVDVIFIEFHFHGPEKLQSILKNNSFEFFTLNPESEIGMIYAFNTKK